MFINKQCDGDTLDYQKAYYGKRKYVVGINVSTHIKGALLVEQMGFLGFSVPYIHFVD